MNLLLATSLLNRPEGWIIIGAIVLWLVINAAVATYGYDCGYNFTPLFISAIILGPVGPGIVLLVVTVGAGAGARARR